MNSKQFAWIYMIDNGFAGVRPSFYGGYDPEEGILEKYDVGNTWYRDRDLREAMRREIKEKGVDWEKTEAPRSTFVSQFTDTFHDPEQKEYIRGTLVLKDGTKQNWISDPIEVTNVFDMMEMFVSQMEGHPENRLREIFGE